MKALLVAPPSLQSEGYLVLCTTSLIATPFTGSEELSAEEFPRLDHRG